MDFHMKNFWVFRVDTLTNLASVDWSFGMRVQNQENSLLKQFPPGDSKWPFYPIFGGHDSPLKGSFNHPKKVTKNRQATVFSSFFLGGAFLIDRIKRYSASHTLKTAKYFNYHLFIIFVIIYLSFWLSFIYLIIFYHFGYHFSGHDQKLIIKW